jgi:hypothetical protein
LEEKTNRKYSFACCFKEEILQFVKDKIKEEEKLYCLEPDGDELADGVVGISKKFFLLHRFACEAN